MFRRCLACSSPIYFTPKLSTTRTNAMGRVECVQRPEVFLVGAYLWGARTDVSFAGARTPAWGRRYTPFRISKNTQLSGVTYCCKLYSCMNCSGICYVCKRKFSSSFKFVFRYIFIRSKPAHRSPRVDSVLLMRILAVDRSTVGVPMS